MKSARLRAALTIILAALLALIAVVWAPPAHAATWAARGLFACRPA